MALTKYKIGDLITAIDERNICGIRDFYGININKEFMPTVANTEGINETKYKVIRKGRFVFSGMQTGRDRCIRIGMYNEESPIIVSPAYTTFEVTATKIVLPIYFFMWFLSAEKDRLGWFYSDGSIRANLDWDRFCDIEMELPNISIQQKYVDIYNAMLENQKNYERGLEDLKLVCDGYIEDLRRNYPCEAIGKYLKLSDTRNSHGLSLENVRGISINKTFIETKADMKGVSLNPYLLVKPDYFAYVPVTSRNGEKITIAHNTTDHTYLVSSSYIVFFVKKYDLLDSDYLFMYFNRPEFDRFARFNSWGSARETFDWDEMCNMQIPIPNIKIQKAIAEIFEVYNMRKEINEKLKAQIKDICPILIRGSLEEN